MYNIYTYFVPGGVPDCFTVIIVLLLSVYISLHLQPTHIAPPNCNPKDCVTSPLRKCLRLTGFVVPLLMGPPTKTATAITGPPANHPLVIIHVTRANISLLNWLDVVGNKDYFTLRYFTKCICLKHLFGVQKMPIRPADLLAEGLNGVRVCRGNEKVRYEVGECVERNAYARSDVHPV